MSGTASPRTAWRDNGFSAPPDVKTASGTEIIYRAVGGVSVKPWSNCFFTPVVAGTPVNYWTAEMLERELSAALWGNDFERVFVYQMLAGVHYEIGPIAHDDYAGIDGTATSNAERGFYQRSWVTPSGVFRQVRFLDFSPGGMTRLVVPRDSFTIGAGGYAREQAGRARRHLQ
jgi:hypothetical protein